MAVASFAPAKLDIKIRDRFELHQQIGQKGEVKRYRGVDLDDKTPILVAVGPAPEQPAPVETEPVEVVEAAVEDDIMPSFDDAALGEAVAIVDSGAGSWPSLAWEKDLLEKVNHPVFPRVIDYFTHEGQEVLVTEEPQGSILWDAWDDPDSTSDIRYGYIQQLTEGLQALHQQGAILEGVRPDHVVVNDGKVALTDFSDLLPLPVPANAPIRGGLYTAPELILKPAEADGRATLYSLGAMLYSLEYLHHSLEEKDFEGPYTPRQVTDRYPDVHPLFPRVVNKTFVRDPNSRFPSDEQKKIDASGLTELIKTFETCRRVLDRVRLDVAAWTTTGMVRTGNEDAFHFLHGVEGREDDVYEYCMVLLCDGMGGYDSGEVAAAMAIAEMKKYFLTQPQFAGLSGKDTPEAVAPHDVETMKKLLDNGLRQANREIFTFSRTPGKGKRGMGCTAEAVYVDCNNVIVGHVGDSRTYHLSNGRLIQLTRDQTLVNRLVELGQISEAEAEHHDRKNELQQAVGGQPDVQPGTYSGRLKRGDWVLVCSDGLTNHIPTADLEKMLTRETAGSSEEAARRLLNLVNLRGATDNATIVVIRAT